MDRFHSEASRRRATRLAAAPLLACLLLACGGAPALTYPGPRKPAAEVGLLSTEVRVKVLKIDGRAVNASNFELLPGEHRVDVKLTFRGEEINAAFKDMRSSCYSNAKFIAEPGVEYRIVKVSQRGKAKDRPGVIMWGHSFGVDLLDVTHGESIPSAMAPMSC